MQLTKFQKVVKAFKGPASVCNCGHTGDKVLGSTAEVQHDGVQGHGACTVCPPGTCDKFQWKGFTPELQAALDAAK